MRDGRGAVIADFNADGRLDLAVNNNNAAPSIYLNHSRAEGNWIMLELVGSGKSPRDAIGARVRLKLPGKSLTRWVEAGSGYASQSELALHFGLGKAERIDGLEITWPSGRVERLPGNAFGVNQRLRVEEGKAEPVVLLSHSAMEDLQNG